MGHHTAITQALMDRRLMPLVCTCGYCGCTGFDRDQMASPKKLSHPLYDAIADLGGTVCLECEELMWLDHDNARQAEDDAEREASLKPCPECAGKAKYHHEWHRVRQETITHWCPACDGRSI